MCMSALGPRDPHEAALMNAWNVYLWHNRCSFSVTMFALSHLCFALFSDVVGDLCVSTINRQSIDNRWHGKHVLNEWDYVHAAMGR